MPATDPLTKVSIWQTPEDAAAALTTIVGFLDGATTSLHCLAYGFNQPDIFNAMIRAHVRGVELRLILDHTQACGPTEVKSLHGFFLNLPPEIVRIGTSPVKRQIMHRKACVADGVRLLTGSLNWTMPGRDEENDLLLIEDPTIAQAVEVQFQRLWNFIDTQEAIYQPSRASFATGAGAIPA